MKYHIPHLMRSSFINLLIFNWTRPIVPSGRQMALPAPRKFGANRPSTRPPGGSGKRRKQITTMIITILFKNKDMKINNNSINNIYIYRKKKLLQSRDYTLTHITPMACVCVARGALTTCRLQSIIHNYFVAILYFNAAFFVAVVSFLKFGNED